MPEFEPPSSTSRTNRSPTQETSNGSDDERIPQKKLIDRLPEAVVVVDEEDQLLFVNARAEDMLGVSQDVLVGTPLSSLVRPVSSSGISVLRDAEPSQETRCELRGCNGTTHRVAVESSSLVYDGREATLITMRRLPERGWRETTVNHVLELFDETFHLGPAALLIVRLRDGLVLEVSERLTEITGLQTTELVGKTLGDIDLDLENAQPTDLARDLITDGELRTHEFRFRAPDGAQRTFVGNARCVEVGGDSCALVSLVDVRELVSQLGDSSPEGTPLRSALLSNVTHEVRTPLTCILGFTSILRKGVPDEYQRFVDLIDRSGRRLRRMLDALLDLAQLEAGTLEVHPEVCSIERLIRENVHDLVVEAETKGLDLTVEVPDPSISLRVDPKLFGRVLKHLVGNAVKFTQSGGVTVRVEAKTDEVSVVVTDTGKGIEAAAMEHVLRPFVQESEGPTRSHQGCGLGLPVSRRLLDRLGGRLEIESEKGKGTTVAIILPRRLDIN